MIDFQNASFVKLGSVEPDDYLNELAPLMVPGEGIQLAFRGIRDSVVFTNKRLIAINVQGISGKKRDFASLPYSKVQAFSVETAGKLDRDVELELWFSGLGSVKLEFRGRADIQGSANSSASTCSSSTRVPRFARSSSRFIGRSVWGVSRSSVLDGA